MSDVHISGLDLNLLRVLDALLEERSATRASRRLGVTQSAVSHALGRLRESLGDPLLVRARDGLVPTPRGESLRAPIRECLSRLDEVLAPERFDPATGTATIRVGLADYGVFLFFPAVYARLEREAPGVDLRLMPAPGGINSALATGAVDAAIGVWGPDEVIPDGIVTRRLLEDRFVCLLRPGNPAVEPWSVQTWAALPHVQIAPQGTPGGILDQILLEQHGLRRRIACTVPGFLAAPQMVASSNAVLTLPERVGAAMAAPLGLELRPLPFPAPPFLIRLGWHARSHADPAQRWFRDVVTAVADAAGR